MTYRISAYFGSAMQAWHRDDFSSLEAALDARSAWARTSGLGAGAEMAVIEVLAHHPYQRTAAPAVRVDQLATGAAASDHFRTQEN